MIKIVVALILFAHGTGHMLGPMRVFNMVSFNPQWQGDSWLLGGAGGGVVSMLGVFIWLLALAGFVALAAVVLGWLPAAWWAPLAVASSLLSLAGFALFPQAFPTSSVVSAGLLDMVVLAAVIYFHWAPSALAD